MFDRPLSGGGGEDQARPRQLRGGGWNRRKTESLSTGRASPQQRPLPRASTTRMRQTGAPSHWLPATGRARAPPLETPTVRLASARLPRSTPPPPIGLSGALAHHTPFAAGCAGALRRDDGACVSNLGAPAEAQRDSSEPALDGLVTERGGGGVPPRVRTLKASGRREGGGSPAR